MVFIQFKFIVVLDIHLIIIEFFRLQKRPIFFIVLYPKFGFQKFVSNEKCQIRMRCLQNYFVTESKVMGENSSQKGVLNYEQSLISAREQRSGQNARARLSEPATRSERRVSCAFLARTFFLSQVKGVRSSSSNENTMINSIIRVILG